MLIALWSLLDQGYSSLVSGVKLTKEKGEALARGSAWAKTMADLRALARGVEAPISAAEYKKLDKGGALPARFAGKQARGRGINNGQHHVKLAGDYDAFVKACEKLVAANKQDEHENQDAYAKWPTDSRLQPSVRFQVTLRDRELLGFVRVGMQFEMA